MARRLLVVALLLAPGFARGQTAAPVAVASPARSGLEIAGLDASVLAAATSRYEALRADGRAKTTRLVILDFTKPSTEKRLWVIDMATHQVLFHDLVAHGKGSGDLSADRFGNDFESHRTSIGTFVTGETYEGKHGYSLRLDGLDAGINDHARARDIVFHGAEYVSDAFGRQYGRLGRSFGCPAVNPSIARPLIDAIAGGSVVFAWGGDASLAAQ